jgi:2-polyprenyl-6-methoxyphenol hydroxylase-like FAD-dependent oxidoreductase
MTDTTVLIVGAGPTGLTVACELARRGVAFRIIDASAGPQRGSRGKGIQPRTLEVLDDLGIVDRVLANGRLAMPIRQIGPDGSVREVDAVTFRDRPDIPYPATLITPEWRIEEALRELLGTLGGRVEFGTALESFVAPEADRARNDPTATDADPAAPDAVVATITSPAGTETISARWLVGCDGGHSVVRKGTGIAFDGETLDSVRMIVADVPVAGLDRDAWTMWGAETGMLALCPLPSTDAFQFQASIAPGQDPELSVANLQRLVEERTGRTDIRIGEPVWSSLWRANIRIVDHYRAGRVFLAGDAAHIHSPAGGQGMNTGIQDAHNLGWKFAAVEHVADPELLDTYDAERRPVAEGVLALSNDRLRQAIAQRGMVVRGDANTMQLTVGYRGSSLAIDDRDDSAAVRAGDRFADAPGLRTVDGDRRLFDLTRGGVPVLFRFGDGPLPAGLPAGLRTYSVVAEASRPGQVVDTDGHLARALGAADGALVLLRPDGYIAGIADDGDAARLAPLLAVLAPAI